MRRPQCWGGWGSARVGGGRAQGCREEHGFQTRVCLWPHLQFSSAYSPVRRGQQSKAGLELPQTPAEPHLFSLTPPSPQISTKGLLGKIKCRKSRRAEIVHSGGWDIVAGLQGLKRRICKYWATMRMASVWPQPVSCPYFPNAHLHASLLWVCLHGLQCSLSPTALHNDPAVLWLAQSQDA